MEEDERLSYSVADNVAWIRLQTDSRGLILMTTGIMALLRRSFVFASKDDNVRVIVLTGTGRSFMAGADLAFVRDALIQEFRLFSRENQALATEMVACDKPIVVGINGDAIGGGLELALAGDIRVCVTTARLAFPEVKVGLLHSTGSSYLLPRLVGLGRAKELVITGRQLDATEALNIGLVSSVCEPESLEQTLSELAAQIASNAPNALKWAKKIFDLGSGSDFGSAIAIEEIGNLACFDTADRVEAANAFFERRPPIYWPS